MRLASSSYEGSRFKRRSTHKRKNPSSGVDLSEHVVQCAQGFGVQRRPDMAPNLHKNLTGRTPPDYTFVWSVHRGEPLLIPTITTGVASTKTLFTGTVTMT